LQLKKIQEAKREEKKRLADEDATRRIRQLEEQCAALQKQVRKTWHRKDGQRSLGKPLWLSGKVVKLRK
jgi:hypothetical protein